MIPANDVQSSPTARKNRRWGVPVGVIALLALAGCATPVGGATSSTTPSASASVAPSSTPSAADTPTAVPTPSVTPFSGDVLIVTAEVVGGDLEVTAMIPRVSEGDGTCTLELVGTDRTLSVTGTEGKDVTYCGVMSIPLDAPSSTPQFRVRYESPSTRAESAVSTVEPAP